MIGWLTAPLRRRKAAKLAAQQARAEMYARAQAIIDGYDHPELAPSLERVVELGQPKRRRHRLSRRAALMLASLLATAVAAAGVLAYYTATGHGAAAGAVGTVSDITLAPGTPSTALYPGGMADVALSITNPNTIKVHIPSLVLDSGTITSNQGGCATYVHYTTQNGSGSGYDAQPGTHDLDLTDAIAMDTNTPSSCQGATFKVYLTVGP